MIRIPMAVGLIAVSIVSLAAMEIKKEDLIGAWIYVESYLELPDGQRMTQFSDRPQGIFIILPNGWYSHIILRDDLPMVKSGVMMQATPDEARTLALGSLSHFGNYTVDEKAGTFTVTILKSDFPNFNGVKQTRHVLELNETTLRYLNDLTNAGPGAVVRAHLRRVWKLGEQAR